MLSEAAIRQLSKGEEGKYIFDFSTINSSNYEILFRSLQKFALKNIDTLGFTCDELAKFQSRSTDRAQFPTYVAESIARTKTHYVRNIIELLCHIIPKSPRIREVLFSNLAIRREHIERLSTAFAKSKVLSSIIFSHVKFEDEGVRVLLNGLDPNSIRSISIIKCGITGACTDDIIQFIKRRMEQTIGIQSFEVSPTEISDADRRKIRSALTGVPESPPSPKRYAPMQTEEESEDSEDPEQAAEDAERREKIEDLKTENKKIKDQIRALREMVNAIQCNDSIFVVGKGSAEFVMYLNQIEQRLVSLDGSKRRFP